MTTPPTHADEPDAPSPTTAEAAFALAAQAFGGPEERGDALEQLGRMHREDARADLSWIHPTWLVRAVQDESPAVRAIVAAHGPPPVRRALQRSLATLQVPDRRPHPEVLDWVLSLWTERLVGGGIDRENDPPVIVALARLSPLESYRLWHGVGLVKTRLARGTEATPETRAWARRDFDAAERARAGPRRRTALLGLITAARLLADCEPFRMRWALQRIPYPVVKRIRPFIPSESKRSAATSHLETLILKTAWDRLTHAGRITAPFPPGVDKERP